MGVLRVRTTRAAALVAPAVVAEPRNPHAWVAISRALVMIWVALVIHVVQQADRLPKIDIRTAKRRKILHRISNRIAMFPQTFRLDPIVKNRESAIGKCCHRRRYKSIERLKLTKLVAETHSVNESRQRPHSLFLSQDEQRPSWQGEHSRDSRSGRWNRDHLSRGSRFLSC